MAVIPDEVKRRAVKELDGGISAAKIAEHLTKNGLPCTDSSIYRWRNKLKAFGDVVATPPIANMESIISNHIAINRPRRVLAIPDKHHPFCHPDTLPFLLAVKQKYQTDETVCLGDEIDAHAFSRYPKDPDGMTSGQELRAAIEALIPFYKAFPEMKVCVQPHDKTSQNDERNGHLQRFMASL